MATKHVVTFGFGYADGTIFIPPLGFGNYTSIPAVITVIGMATISETSALITLYETVPSITFSERV